MMKILLILMMLVGVAWGGSAFCDGQGNCWSFSDMPQFMTAECDAIKCPEFYRIDNTVTVDPRVELIAAAEGVLPYLDGPQDRIEGYRAITLEVRPIPTELELAEQAVERLKVKDAAIRRFREALRKAK